jgi:hypothetical protein
VPTIEYACESGDASCEIGVSVSEGEMNGLPGLRQNGGIGMGDACGLLEMTMTSCYRRSIDIRRMKEAPHLHVVVVPLAIDVTNVTDGLQAMCEHSAKAGGDGELPTSTT